MLWFIELMNGESVAKSAIVFCLVISIGLVLGHIKIKGISLGIAGVLFSGILFGHYNFSVNSHVLEFIREFGLILFVFTIGMQIGPSFGSSLKKQGLPLNVMAFVIVLLGALITAIISLYAGVSMPVAVGMFSGATTNTPSLGAATQAIKEMPNLGIEASKLPALGYAVSYPFGVMGIIITICLLKALFRVCLEDETKALAQLNKVGTKKLFHKNIDVRKLEVTGVPISNLPMIGSEVVISRIHSRGTIGVANPDSRLCLGDIVLAVGNPEALERLTELLGIDSKIDLQKISGEIESRKYIITQPKIIGESPTSLNLSERYGVTISRIVRNDMEFPGGGEFRLQLGDRVVVVGSPQALKEVEREFGNSAKTLDQPHLVPIFIGILLGVILGSFPVYFPGAPAPVKLGIAGGPLIVAIILSRIGSFGSLVWYLPVSANLILRELGIVLFLACVGLKAGESFIETLVRGDGVYWMILAALITVAPIILVGIFGRLVMKINFLPLCGVLAGSMTDPPALAFAGAITKSDEPAVAYATVYPLTMLMRIIVAQALVLLLS